ncbi:MAG: thioesterase family protein [Bacteroidetes bacterium]|nr:thioesterase family protein [Bacteroidota bacterium]
MERVKIKLPEHFQFSTEIDIRITDINYGGHVGNDAFLALAHEARTRFLASFGYTELSMEEVSLIMADAAIEFKKELFHGDKVILSVVADGFDKYGFDLFYLFEKQVNSEKLVVAKIKTGMLCYNYHEKKLALLPAGVKEKLSGNA